jgi:hypothetical protein
MTILDKTIREVFSNDLIFAYSDYDDSAEEMTLEDFFHSVEVRWEEIRTEGVVSYELVDAVADVLRDPAWRLKRPNEKSQ